MERAIWPATRMPRARLRERPPVAAAAAIAEDETEIRTGRLQRRNQAEADAGQNRNRQRKAQHRKIDADRQEAGKSDAAGVLEQRYAPLGKQRAHHGARAGEQDTLREQLADQIARGWPRWRRAKRSRAPGRWRARASGSRRWRRRSGARGRPLRS